MALVALDRQHVGVPSRAFRDSGAWGDLDRDGVRDVVELEGLMTARYGLAAEIRLRELGHDVVVLSDGQYAERHERVNRYKARVYVALHVNAGGGKYGLVVHDHRSARGAVLGDDVATRLRAACPELTKVTVEPGMPGTWTENAYRCIAGVAAVAVCFEPYFIDQLAHAPLMTEAGLVRVGRALADGIDAWLKRSPA